MITIEQLREKAKAYDKVREKIALRFGSNVAEEIFSEFEMSEDERIREDILTFIRREGQHIDKYKWHKWIAWLEKQGEQKPVIKMKTPEESLGISSEEYNKIVDECIYGDDKSTWSEEDEVKINRIVACLENLNVADNDILLKDINWLKSIRPQNTWKPSDEQLKALNTVNVTGCITEVGQGKPLVELYEQLKKLKGE